MNRNILLKYFPVYYITQYHRLPLQGWWLQFIILAHVHKDIPKHEKHNSYIFK